MKAGWHKTTLGAVAQVGAGNSAPQGDAPFADGIYPFFRTSDAGRVRFGDITESSDYLNGDGIKGLRLLPAGTILFPKSGASTFLNHRVMMVVDGYVSSHLATIVGDESKVDRRFLLYFLSTVSAQDLVQDHAYPSLNLPLISAIPVLLPPLPEQQRIVAILDEAFDGIATAKANAEKNLQNSRALFESQLQSVFTERGEGWVEMPLGELCDFLNGFAFKSSDALADSGTQLVRMGNLYGSKLDLERNAVFYPDSFVLEYRRYILNEGDIIMSLTGTTGKEDYGFAVRVPESDRTLLINQRIAKFDAIKEDKVSRDYLLHYLRSRAFLDILYPTANGTRQANLSTVTMKALPVPLCPISEQKMIASSLDSLAIESQRLESHYQHKLNALDDLKKSLLHQAFSGQL
jgi:type I restriction enzyme S subunit